MVCVTHIVTVIFLITLKFTERMCLWTTSDNADMDPRALKFPLNLYENTSELVFKGGKSLPAGQIPDLKR